MKRLAMIPLLVAMSAHAADVPIRSGFDDRIQYANYNAREVVELFGAVGIDSWIIVGEGETILKATAAKADGWLLTFDGRVLTAMPRTVNGVQPTAKDWNTSLNMMTNERFYTIDLRVLGPSDGLSRAAFRLEYQYPTEAAIAAQAAADQRAEESAQCSSEKTEAIRPRNQRYTKTIHKSTKDFRPDIIFDDDRGFTYFKFDKGAAMPVFYTVTIDADGEKEETIANFHTGTWVGPESSADGRIHVLLGNCGPKDTAVIQTTASGLMLRDGERAIYVDNLEK